MIKNMVRHIQYVLTMYALMKGYEMNKIPCIEELIEDVLPDGTPVKAMCRYWAKDVDVEMISPYPGLRTGIHSLYMTPTRFTDNDLWKRWAHEMVADLVARGRWIDAHLEAVQERRQEGKRRIDIASKYIKMLTDERKDWKQKLKNGFVDQRMYQKQVNAIDSAIQPLKLIVFDQDENNWLMDGIVQPITYPLELPHPCKRHGIKNVHVYLQDSALLSDAEKGWIPVLETQVPEVDFAIAGLGEPVNGHSAINLVAFSAYLNRRDGDKIGVILDVWREITRKNDAWCATVA